MEIPEWGRTFSGFGGKNIPLMRDFKPRGFTTLFIKCNRSASLFQDDLDKSLFKVDA